MGYEIRKLESIDNRILRAFFRLTNSHSLAYQIRLWKEERRYTEDFGKHRHDTAVAAIYGDRIIGLAWARVSPGSGTSREMRETPEIKIAVENKYQKHGIGKNIITMLLYSLAVQDFCEAEAVIDKNAASLEFFLKLGFESVREESGQYHLIYSGNLMKMLKERKWCEYKGREYVLSESFTTQSDIKRVKKSYKDFRPDFYKKAYAALDIHVGGIELEVRSRDRYSPEHGFIIVDDDNDVFYGIKIVHRSDIGKVYEYRSYAVYKGIKCIVHGIRGIQFREGLIDEDYGKYFIATDDWVSICKESELLNTLKGYGFERGYEIGHGYFLFEKYVSPYDPDLQVFVERTEIDINEV